MARPLAKSPFVLLSVLLWILASSASLAKDDNLKTLNQRIHKLFTEGNFQDAIPLEERAVEATKRARGPEDPETATALNNLGSLFQKIGDYAKAEPLFQEALGIQQKVLGPNILTQRSPSITWPGFMKRWASTPKPNHSMRKRSG